MSRFESEKATHAEDLPHQFEKAAAKPHRCDLCGGGTGDVRHLAWDREQLAQAERASARDTMHWETGS